MELKINLATATLKDAEHAIFLIGAYFGLTQATVGDVRVTVPGQDPSKLSPVAAATIVAAAHTPVHPQALGASPDAAAVFGAQPSPLSPDPAQVFGGNVATGAAMPSLPGTVGASVLPAAVQAAGDAGNANGMAAGSVPGLPSAPTAVAPVGLPAAQAPAPVASALPGVELDADGLPWDNRIHASSEGGAKPKNADGRWRKRRGLNDAELVARVQAELRQTLAAGTPAAGPGYTIAGGPLPAGTVVGASGTMPPQAPVAPQAPQAPAAPVGPPTTFEQLMPRVTKAMQDGILPQGALLAAVTAYNVPTVPALVNRPDLVPTIWAYLQAVYPAIA